MKSQAWRVIANGGCIGTMYFGVKYSENHVLACAKQEFGRNDVIVEKA